jgi:hypothetical protein
VLAVKLDEHEGMAATPGGFRIIFAKAYPPKAKAMTAARTSDFI